MVVVRDDQDGLSAGFQLGQQLRVEDVFEERVLVRSPFVEEVERTVLQVGGEQREALTLALRKFRRGELAVLDLHLVREVELLEILLRLRIAVLALDAHEPVEQMEIREHGGEVLTVIVAILVGDDLAVNADLSALRRVESGEDLGQGGLAAAVAADEVNEFPGVEVEIDRADHKRLFLVLTTVGVGDVDQGEMIEIGRQRLAGAIRRLLGGATKHHAQFIDLAQRSAGAAKDRHAAQHA